MEFKKFGKGRKIVGLGVVTEVFEHSEDGLFFTQYKINGQYYHEKVISEYLLDRHIMKASFKSLVFYINRSFSFPSGVDGERIRRLSFLLATSSKFREKIDKYPSSKREYLTANISIALDFVEEEALKNKQTKNLKTNK